MSILHMRRAIGINNDGSPSYLATREDSIPEGTAGAL